MYFLQPLIRPFSILCLLAVLYSLPLQASSIIDLGTLGGPYIEPLDINNKGEIVGQAEIASGMIHPFVYSAGHVTDLLPMTKKYALARAINDAGQIVGVASTTTESHAVLYTGGMAVEILGPADSGQSIATAINDRGEIVGYDNGQPFLYSGGQLTHFAGTYRGQPTAINNRGQIVGSSDFGGSFPDGHAFLYTAGQLKDLGTVDTHQTASQAASINNAGHVVGVSFGPGDEPGYTFLYAEGKMTHLDYPFGPSDINDSDEIVGGADFGSRWCSGRVCPEAALYSDGVLTNLNSFLPEGSDWTLVDATAINDKGQIVGIGFHRVPVGDEYEFIDGAFLLDTTPEPATLLLMGGGLVGLALLHRKVMRGPKMGQVARCNLSREYTDAEAELAMPHCESHRFQTPPDTLPHTNALAFIRDHFMHRQPFACATLAEQVFKGGSQLGSEGPDDDGHR